MIDAASSVHPANLNVAHPGKQVTGTRKPFFSLRGSAIPRRTYIIRT